LSRIIYKEGDIVSTLDDRKIKITDIHDIKGLIHYAGVDEDEQEVRINELALNCFIKLVTPQQRLFTDQIDKLRSFRLRIDTLHHMSRLQQSPVRGLLGSRTSHIAHQVYIASEIAERYAPRVLLADEVGLGKTIEAGMILHHQLQSGRASRVLIVVPNTLIHQWLVEMIRRFNLYFSIFDQSRYESLQSDELENIELADNPFESEQLVLCSLEFLMANEKAREHAIGSSWDLLVVDEAHHLHWSEEAASPEYQCIEQLSAKSLGLLLLTATPEQAGISGHFARLRLLDPARFHNLDLFKKEEKNYAVVNQFVERLLDYKEKSQGDVLNDELKTDLKKFHGENTLLSINDTIRDLLDRHGTGRVLFRNTRAAIKGFPEREVHHYPLTCPALYESEESKSVIDSLIPEHSIANEEWLNNDPRVEWLSNKIINLFPEKILIICARKSTAIALENYLKIKSAVRCSSFHEGLSIIERDRAAAYFAEEENGAQVLICSEIGSEGRNFQFSHHLVLFDLPLNPDLLEQRIGRLDRIGQKHTIQIHVPYLLNTAQEKLFRWYHEGINLFEKSNSAGYSIYENFEKQLLAAFTLEFTEDNNNQFEKLIADTKTYTNQITQLQSEGRDRLLEMHSCNRPAALELISAIESEENSLELESYMGHIFHEFGIDQEFHSEYAEILRPSEHMKTSDFPGLKEDGVTVTYSRTKALFREDMEFLSWEHPMVTDTMDIILNSELGNATLATIALKGIAPGTLFLESFYTINCAAPKCLQLDRFIPITPIRVLIDLSGKNLTNILDYQKLNSLCEKIKRHMSHAIIKQVRGDIETMLDYTNTIVEKQMSKLLEKAKTEMHEKIGYEINRLEALQKVNSSIRNDEIAFLKNQINDSDNYINQASLKLQALRVVINHAPEKD
jgi:ATP-dependent helicase HepA